MANYLAFGTTEDPLLLEVAVDEVNPPPGVAKAGLGDQVQKSVAKARESFEDALSALVRVNVGSFLAAVNGLPERPHEVEITFAVKGTGELGNLAVGKLGGEANYSVRLAWSWAGQ
jgi:hypothetical protein